MGLMDQTHANTNSVPLTRREKLLMQEVQACDDPICCCEAEPRWLAFQQAQECATGFCEWENLNRYPAEEL